MTFQDSTNIQVQVLGQLGQSPLRLVKIYKLVKVPGKEIFALKLNKPLETSNMGEPKWLKELDHVFLEELIDLPPPQG